VTITKALAKTANCTFITKKWRGTTKNKLSGVSRRTGAPTFKFVPAPLFLHHPRISVTHFSSLGYTSLDAPFAQFCLRISHFRGMASISVARQKLIIAPSSSYIKLATNDSDNAAISDKKLYSIIQHFSLPPGPTGELPYLRSPDSAPTGKFLDPTDAPHWNRKPRRPPRRGARPLSFFHG